MKRYRVTIKWGLVQVPMPGTFADSHSAWWHVSMWRQENRCQDDKAFRVEEVQTEPNSEAIAEAESKADAPVA